MLLASGYQVQRIFSVFPLTYCYGCVTPPVPYWSHIGPKSQVCDLLWHETPVSTLLPSLPLCSRITTHYISKPKLTTYVESWAMANGLADQKPGKRKIKRSGSRRSEVEACGWTQENGHMWRTKSSTDTLLSLGTGLWHLAYKRLS